MLTGRVGCTHPHTIEQARNDFKIYMSKLLEHSAALDSFRRDGRQLEGGVGEGTFACGPQGRRRESTGSAEGTGENPPADGLHLPAPPTSSPQRGFRDRQSWPRAGAKTPPAQKISANFSWKDDPAKGGPDAMTGVGRELFTVDSGREEDEQGLATFPPSSAHARNDCFAAASGSGGGDELDGAPEEDWKAVWARRFARGSIQSEYQDRFPWPTSTTPWRSSSLAPAAPPLKASGIPIKSDVVSQQGLTSGAPPLEIPRRPRSALGLELSSRRSDGGSRGAASIGTAKEVEGEVTQSRDDHRSLMPSRQPRYQQPPSVRSPGAAMGELRSPEEGDIILSDNGAPSVHGSDQASAWGAAKPGEMEDFVGEGREEEVPEPVAGEAVALQSRAVEVGSSLRGTSWMDEEAFLEPGKREVVASISKSRARRFEAEKEASMTGGKTLDYSGHHSSRSVMTEYMQEFAWPADRPDPGQRGKRTGMGIDQVGRLLSGKRAEEWQKVPDPNIVARLGVAADRALKAASQAHLAELCRLKSPPATARRLVLGLVVALGLRWRRWSDIRAKLLGNKRDLKEFLERFDKDRAGLTSSSLRPFVEDPSLSPAEIGHVAASVVWLSRWLRALHDYLAFREGKEDPVLLSRISVSSSPGGRDVDGAMRRGRRSGSLARRTVSGTVPRVARESAAVNDGGSDVAEGVDLGSAAGLEERRASTAPVRNKHTQGPQGVSGGVTAEGRQDSDRRRDQHHASTHAVATRGSNSFRPPFSTPDVEGEKDGGLEEKEEVMSTYGGEDLGSESVWTIGTVTSRGDVLETRTEDLGDVDGTRVMRELNADATRDRVDRDERGYGGGREDVRRRQRPPTRPVPGRKGRQYPAERKQENASEAKAPRRKCKGETASRFANPKARRPLSPRRNPILAHPRWPPPVQMRERDRTEQRSAFFLGRSSPA